jgi:hypothetical protein
MKGKYCVWHLLLKDESAILVLSEKQNLLLFHRSHLHMKSNRLKYLHGREPSDKPLPHEQ